MKFILALMAAVLLPIGGLAQIAFQFTDLQYMGQRGTSAAAATQPYTNGMVNWWHAPDISSNNPVALWTDRISAKQMVQTNDFFQATNSPDGLCFDGSKFYSIPSSLYVSNNGTFMFIGRTGKAEHQQILFFSTNLTSVFFMGPTNDFYWQIASVQYSHLAPLNPSNQLDLILVSTNGSLIVYTNGVQASSNFLANHKYTMDVFGGVDFTFKGGNSSRVDNSLHGYAQDIIVWTNALTPAQVTTMHNYATTTYDSSTKTPIWTPSLYSGLLDWARADNPQIGLSDSKLQTNNLDFQVFPSSYNPDFNTSRYFSCGSNMKWYKAVTAGNSIARPALATGAGTANDGFSLSASLGSSYGQPTVWFCVFQCTNTSTSQALMDSASPGSNDRQAHYFSLATEPKHSLLYAGKQISTSFYQFIQDVTNRSLMVWSFNSSNSWLRYNGVSFAEGIDVGTNSWKEPLMIMRDVGSGGVFKGYYFEMFGYQASAMTTNHIQEIESVLIAKYGISALPPREDRQLAFKLSSTNAPTGSVSAWTDTIQGQSFSQATGSQQPTKAAGNSNGVAFARASNQYLDHGSDFSITQNSGASNDLVIYFVFKPTSTPSGVYHTIWDSNGGAAGAQIHPSMTINVSSDDVWGTAVLNKVNVVVANEGFYQTNRARWLNGMTNTTSTIPYSSSTYRSFTSRWIGHQSTATYDFNGLIYEIGVYTNRIFGVDDAEKIYKNAMLRINGELEFVVGQVNGTADNSFTGPIGYYFQVYRPVTVTHLGRWDRAGNSGTHAISLRRMTGDVELANVNVTMTGSVDYKYTAISTNLVLEPYTNYVLDSQETSGGDFWYDRNTSTQYTLSIDGDVIGYAINHTSTSATGNHGWGPVNFKYR